MIAVFLPLFEGVYIYSVYFNGSKTNSSVQELQRGSFQPNIKHKRVFKSLRLSPEE